MEDNSPEINMSEKIRKRKRVDRMKTGLLLIMMVWVIVSIVISVSFWFRLSSLTQQMKVLRENQLVIDDYIKAEKEALDKKSESDQTEEEISQSANKKEKEDTDVKETDPQSGNQDGEKASQKETDASDGQTGASGKEEDTSKEEETKPPVPEGVRKVYLTFDDGPSIYTEELLDILDQYQVKATFFVIGKDDEYSREMYKEIVARGHTLGMHSYSHKYNEIYDSMDAFIADFTTIRDYLTSVTGKAPVFYRFPGGSSNQVCNIDMEEFIRYLNEQGITYFDWNVSSGDATSNTYTTQDVLDNVMMDVNKYDTSVILMHDTSTKHATIEALPALLDQLLADGDAILPIDESTVPVQHISAESVAE